MTRENGATGEMGETDGTDVREAHAGALEALGGVARAEAEVDEEGAGGRSEDRAIPGRSAGEDANFDRHPCLHVKNAYRHERFGRF